MSGFPVMYEVCPVSYWGKRPLYQAKVGTGPSDLIMVKRVRNFYVGQCIKFARLADVRGMCVGCPPQWVGGYIWKIESERLFVERM